MARSDSLINEFVQRPKALSGTRGAGTRNFLASQPMLQGSEFRR